MISNYLKLDDFDLYFVKKLIFIQIRNNLIFIKKKSPWTPMSQLSPVCRAGMLSKIADFETTQFMDGPLLTYLDNAKNWA